MKYYEPIDCIRRNELFGPTGIAGVVPLLVLLESGEFQVRIPPETVPVETVLAWVLCRKMLLRPAVPEDFDGPNAASFYPAVDSLGADIWVEKILGEGKYLIRRRHESRPANRDIVEISELFINEFDYRKRAITPHWRGPK
jgi:hypothetical protein